jgi:hypothetical protein
MFGSRQQLLRLTWDEINEQLDKGARVVWMQRTIPSGDKELFDAVLDTEIQTDVSPVDVIRGFLGSVSPSKLEKGMLEDDCIQLTPGEAALKVLGGMVKE